ncbi:hypothetical protein BJV74DRAFT_794919 [Russula compacta]|nr:hypothetical protein BJV74DRAFT_794919 [Russula compacta]
MGRGEYVQTEKHGLGRFATRWGAFIEDLTSSLLRDGGSKSRVDGELYETIAESSSDDVLISSSLAASMEVSVSFRLHRSLVVMPTGLSKVKTHYGSARGWALNSQIQLWNRKLASGPLYGRGNVTGPADWFPRAANTPEPEWVTESDHHHTGGYIVTGVMSAAKKDHPTINTNIIKVLNLRWYTGSASGRPSDAVPLHTLAAKDLPKKCKTTR